MERKYLVHRSECLNDHVGATSMEGRQISDILALTQVAWDEVHWSHPHNSMLGVSVCWSDPLLVVVHEFRTKAEQN